MSVVGFNTKTGIKQYDYEHLDNKLEKSAIAEEFDSSKTYAVGDLCINNGLLYKRKTAGKGAWNASQWDLTSVDEVTAKVDELNNLKEDLSDKVAKNQGASNVGKSLVVGDDGIVGLDFAGLSDDAKNALLNCFSHVAWTDAHGQDYYDSLAEALMVEPVKPIITLADWTYPVGMPTDKGFTQHGNSPTDDGTGLYYSTYGGYICSVPLAEDTERIIYEITITPLTNYVAPADTKHDGIRISLSKASISINSLGIIYVDFDSSSNYTAIHSVSLNTPYRIRLDINIPNETMDVYVDDVLEKQDMHVNISSLHTATSANLRVTSTTGNARYRLNSLSCKVQ